MNTKVISIAEEDTYLVSSGNRDNFTGSSNPASHDRSGALSPTVRATDRKREDIIPIFHTPEECVHKDCKGEESFSLCEMD